MNQPIMELKHCKPLAVGGMRLVFPHPDDPELLVKVIRPEIYEERWGAGRAWYKRPRRHGRFSSYVREVQEFLVGCAASDPPPHFVQKIHGFTDTDHGLGLVVEAVRDAAGGYAKTLDMIVKEGAFTPEVAAALETVITQLLASDIIISDPHAGNLVYGHTAEHGNHFVLIDGLGNNNLIPFKAMSRRINRRSKLKRFATMKRYIAGIMPGVERKVER